MAVIPTSYYLSMEEEHTCAKLDKKRVRYIEHLSCPYTSIHQ